MKRPLSKQTTRLAGNGDVTESSLYAAEEGLLLSRMGTEAEGTGTGAARPVVTGLTTGKGGGRRLR